MFWTRAIRKQLRYSALHILDVYNFLGGIGPLSMLTPDERSDRYTTLLALLPPYAAVSCLCPPLTLPRRIGLSGESSTRESRITTPSTTALKCLGLQRTAQEFQIFPTWLHTASNGTTVRVKLPPKYRCNSLLPCPIRSPAETTKAQNDRIRSSNKAQGWV